MSSENFLKIQNFLRIILSLEKFGRTRTKQCQSFLQKDKKDLGIYRLVSFAEMLDPRNHFQAHKGQEFY